MTRDQGYAPFLDWLKCIGMLLIIYGHLVGWAPLAHLPPIYLKQIGVACFLFATGYSLSRDQRDRWKIVYNRLFEVYLFGIVCAVVVTAAWYPIDGGLRLSNYEPFVLGVNVVVNDFPANPSTWYLGTYVHIILLWALLLYRRQPPWVVIAGCAVAEIAIRAMLMRQAGLFIAYMAFTNWMTVFLLGYRMGTDDVQPSRDRRGRAWGATAAIAVGAGIWASVTGRIALDPTFPFMQFQARSLGTALGVSAMVSTLYVGATWLAFQAVRAWPAPAPVRFVARNTLVIFLGHMPLLYALAPTVTGWTDNRVLRSLVYVTATLVGLGYLSEGLRRLMRPRELRNQVYAWVTAGARTPRSAGTP